MEKEKLQKAKHLEVGELGEDIACRFLEERGFHVKERNYRKKWGEIDIIAEKDGVTSFIEVKTVTREIGERESLSEYRFEPEDNIHPWKVKRLMRAIDSYLLAMNDRSGNKHKELPWQFDVVALYMDVSRREARVRFTEKIIL